MQNNPKGNLNTNCPFQINESLNTNTNDRVPIKQMHLSDNLNVQQAQNETAQKSDQKFKIIQFITKHYVVLIVFIIFFIAGITTLIVVLNLQKENEKIPNFTHHLVVNEDEQIYDLIVLNTTSALCLDGSPASYYISRTGNPQKVFIHFQGGGWCAHTDYQSTLQSCQRRSKQSKGSSKYNQSIRKFQNAQLSNNEQNYFRQWKRIYIPYCDGTGFQGTRNQPINYNNSLIYFRGHNITVEVFQSLQKHIGFFSSAEEIVMSGVSAGGIASTYWSNYVADKVASAKVYNFAKSSIFLDKPTHLGVPFISQSYKIMMNITNQQITHPITQCVIANPTQTHKCMFLQYIYPFLKVPMFIVQSLYDIYGIHQILGIDCDESSNLFSLVKCTTQQFQRINSYRESVKQLLKSIKAQNQLNGAWAIDCVEHYFIENVPFSEKYQVPQHSGNHYMKAVSEWMQGSVSQNFFLDNVLWPNNVACS